MSTNGGASQPPQGGNDMSSNTKTLALRADLAAAASTGRQLAALDKMTVGELGEKYRELFGEPTRTRNKEYLRKRIAWRIQECAEGGLSPRALERIEQLAPEAPVRWRQPITRKDSPNGHFVLLTKPGRDPRLPPVGTVLRRMHDGIEHHVTVLGDSFEYRGESYRSLSKLARVITGTPWNGFLFFFGRSHGSGTATKERVR
jgi:hypothetical protein